MRLLLDTHVLLWACTRQRQPGAAAREALRRADVIYVSAISFAEIAIKASIGKLEVPENLHSVTRDFGAKALHLTPRHGLLVQSLPMVHRDPFDRLLLAQALEDDLSIVSSDRRFPEYPVKVIPAL